MTMARQKKAAGAKEADPIMREIRSLVDRTFELEDEISELKAQTKAVSGELETAWKRLRQLNAEQTRTYPLLEGKEAEAEAPPGSGPKAGDGPSAPDEASSGDSASGESTSDNSTSDCSTSPSPANWRTVPVSDLERFGLAKKIVATLGEGGMGTIGDISKLNEKGLSLTDVKGIGEKAAEKIEAALDAFWKAWGPVDEGGSGDSAPPADEAPAPPADEAPVGPTSGLTDDQVRELAQRLEGSNANVYDAAEAVAGVRPSEGIFGHLRSIAGLMRCPNCGVWKEVPDFAIDEADPECLNGVPLCFECLNADVAN